MSAITLIRLTSGVAIDTGNDNTSCIAPSVRTRTRTRSCCGSMCTSDARSRTACSKMRLTTLTIGAFSSTATSGVAAPVSRTSLLRPMLELLQRAADLGLVQVGAFDRVRDIRRRRHEQPDRRVQQRDELRLQLRIQGIGDRDLDPSTDLAQRQHAEAARLLLGQQPDDGDVGPGAGDVDRFEADLLGQRGAEPPFGDDAELDEDLTESLSPRGLGAERIAQLLAREIAPLDEQSAERRDAASGAGATMPRSSSRRAEVLRAVAGTFGDHLQFASSLRRVSGRRRRSTTAVTATQRPRPRARGTRCRRGRATRRSRSSHISTTRVLSVARPSVGKLLHDSDRSRRSGPAPLALGPHLDDLRRGRGLRRPGTDDRLARRQRELPELARRWSRSSSTPVTVTSTRDRERTTTPSSSRTAPRAVRTGPRPLRFRPSS